MVAVGCCRSVHLRLGLVETKLRWKLTVDTKEQAALEKLDGDARRPWWSTKSPVSHGPNRAGRPRHCTPVRTR